MSKTTSHSTNNKKSQTSIIWLLSVAFIAVGLLLFCQFYFGDSVNSKSTYYNNTHINGLNVSGMTKDEAQGILMTKIVEDKDKINI